MSNLFTSKLLSILTVTTLAIATIAARSVDARGAGGHGGGGARPARGHGSARNPYANRNNFHNNNMAHRYHGYGYGRGWGGGYGGYGYGGYGRFSNNNVYSEPTVSPADSYNQSEDRRRQNTPVSACIHEYHWPTNTGSTPAVASVSPPSHANELSTLHNGLVR